MRGVELYPIKYKWEQAPGREQGCRDDFLHWGQNLKSFKNVAHAVRHSLNHALRQVLCARNIKFCAFTIKVLKKHSTCKPCL